MAEPNSSPTVEVPLDALQSIVESATTAAVRHALSGLPHDTRGVLAHRTGELHGLIVGRVVTSLAASGYLHRRRPEVMS